MRISRKEAFSFGLARKRLAHYEGTPLHLDMRSVLDKIAESLEGDITIEPDWLSEHVGVMPEDCVKIAPEVWAQIAGFIERREEIRVTYQTFGGMPWDGTQREMAANVETTAKPPCAAWIDRQTWSVVSKEQSLSWG